MCPPPQSTPAPYLSPAGFHLLSADLCRVKLKLANTQEQGGIFWTINAELLSNSVEDSKRKWRIWSINVCVIVMASVCVNAFVCVLSVWGKSLHPWVESRAGRTHRPNSHLAGSHSQQGTGQLESIHHGFLCFLSNQPSLIVSLWHVLWQFPPPFKKTWTPSPEKGSGGRKERGRKKKGGSARKRKMERESGPQFLWRLAPANPRNPQRMRLVERARKGWRRGAYENGRGWRQSLIRRKPWVSAVAGNGSSCLGGRLNNTVCLSRGVGIGSFTARIVRIYDFSMDWLTGYFLTETLNYPPHRFRDIFAFGSLIARGGTRYAFFCSVSKCVVMARPHQKVKLRLGLR